MDPKPARDRAHVVCTQCHARKVKCDLQDSPNGKCRHCLRSNHPCIRRNGVRKSRRLTAAAPRPPMEQEDGYRGFSGQCPNELGVLSPSQSSDAATATIVSPSNKQLDSFIAIESVLYDAAGAKTPQAVASQPSLNIRDEILRVTQAAILPRLSMLQALKDAFFEHMAHFYPIVDPSDIANPDSSVLLQQAVCLAGSLLRHDQSSLAFASCQYEKVKTLIYLNYEPENILVLKTLCIMICWSPSSTDLVTMDGPWQWAGMAIRLALQMGLHKQSTYINHPNAGSLRRIFWHLVNTDKITTTCWGRPPALRVDDYDVDLPSISDFPTHNISATMFLECRKLIGIIGTIGELNLQKGVIPPVEISKIITSLCNWQRDLPDELRLFDPNGLRRPFYRPASELYIYYFVAIILLQMIGQKPSTQWPSATPALIASSCIASLYEEIITREQTTYLLHYHGFLCMAATVPLMYCNQSLENDAPRHEMMDVITSILQSLKFKYGGADFVLRKLQRLRCDFTRFEKPMLNDASFSMVAQSLESKVNQLFPFPSSFYFGINLAEFVDSADCSEALVNEPNATLFDILSMDLGTFDIFENQSTLEAFEDEQGMDRT